MQYCEFPARPDWVNLVSADGVPYHTVHGIPYWDDSAAFVFTPDEIERLKLAAEEIDRMYRKTLDVVANDPDRLKMWFSPRVAEAIHNSWRSNPPTLFGRIDVVLLPDGNIKLYEYNAQTPSTLPESSVAQWNWLNWQQEQGNIPATAGQFSDAFEFLVDQWKASGLDPKEPVYIATLNVSEANDGGEDYCNAALMCDAAAQAGFNAVLINMNTDITLANTGPHKGKFVFTPELDANWFDQATTELKEQIEPLVDTQIKVMFMLYPWEWILIHSDEGGPAPFAEPMMNLIENGDLVVIEPLYSVLKTSKLMLPLLCELFPNSPYLLDASFGEDVTVPMKMHGYVKKVAFGREGANIEIRLPDGSMIADTPGVYGQDGLYILQEYCEMPGFADSKGTTHYPVLGIWLVGGKAAGMSIRSVPSFDVDEGMAPVTDDTARFIPHIVS